MLGSGAFGAVYEAVREPLGRRVALKVLHSDMVRVPEAVARFLREAELVARLEHPHIVGVFDLGEHEGVPYLAMEFLDGRTLDATLSERGQASAADALAWLLPIASALHTVHAHGIVHRDLKPANIFLAELPTGDAQPKLLDFGVAKAGTGAVALTRNSALIGTPTYMSPEQVNESKEVGPASDQWAFAVILFECVTGSVPFGGDSLIAVLNAITRAPLPSMRSICPSIHEGFEMVVNRALERDSTRRYRSMKAFAQALLPFADDVTQRRWAAHFDTSIGELEAARSRLVSGLASTELPSGASRHGHQSADEGRRRGRLRGPDALEADHAVAETLTPRATTLRTGVRALMQRSALRAAITIGLPLLVGVAAFVGLRRDEPRQPTETHLPVTLVRSVSSVPADAMPLTNGAASSAVENPVGPPTRDTSPIAPTEARSTEAPPTRSSPTRPGFVRTRLVRPSGAAQRHPRPIRVPIAEPALGPLQRQQEAPSARSLHDGRENL